MDVHIIPALADNYMYLVVDRQTKEAAIVDPVEPAKVMDAITGAGGGNINLKTILTTHHHWDHAGGNKNMLQMIPGLEVVGGDPRVEAITRMVAHGDQLTIGQLQVECLFTPCHTRGHICYKISGSGKDEQEQISLFTGDTLFVAGCGKFFEGTGQQMYDALITTIGTLPEHTKIYCGHEYTLGNLKFAKHVEPNNAAIDDKMQFALNCKQSDRPTVPSTVREEKTYNPFMRVGETSVQDHCGGIRDPVQVMAALRQEKDSFKPK